MRKLLAPYAKALDLSLRDFASPLPVVTFDFDEQSVETPSPDITSVLRVRAPKRSLSQVVLPDATHAQLQAAVAIAQKRELIFDRWGMADVVGDAAGLAVNLYGPSGTGKTLCAEALAHELGVGYLPISYAQLESKYVGETAKNIEAAFDLAQEEGALLFFDEADSILGRRVTDVRQSGDHAVNVSRSTMLMRLEGFAGIVVFATNLLANYDPAFIRRLPLLVYFAPPDTVQLREALWRVHVPPSLPLAGDVELAALAQEFGSATGGDIRNAVLMAVVSTARAEGPDEGKAVPQSAFREAMQRLLQARAAFREQAAVEHSVHFGVPGTPCPGDGGPTSPAVPA